MKSTVKRKLKPKLSLDSPRSPVAGQGELLRFKQSQYNERAMTKIKNKVLPSPNFPSLNHVSPTSHKSFLTKLKEKHHQGEQFRTTAYENKNSNSDLLILPDVLPTQRVREEFKHRRGAATSLGTYGPVAQQSPIRLCQQKDVSRKRSKEKPTLQTARSVLKPKVMEPVVSSEAASLQGISLIQRGQKSLFNQFELIPQELTKTQGTLTTKQDLKAQLRDEASKTLLYSNPTVQIKHQRNGPSIGSESFQLSYQNIPEIFEQGSSKLNIQMFGTLAENTVTDQTPHSTKRREDISLFAEHTLDKLEIVEPAQPIEAKAVSLISSKDSHPRPQEVFQVWKAQQTKHVSLDQEAKRKVPQIFIEKLQNQQTYRRTLFNKDPSRVDYSRRMLKGSMVNPNSPLRLGHIPSSSKLIADVAEATNGQSPKEALQEIQKQKKLFETIRMQHEDQMNREGSILHRKTRRQGLVVGGENHQSTSTIFSLACESDRIQQLPQAQKANAFKSKRHSMPFSQSNKPAESQYAPSTLMQEPSKNGISTLPPFVQDTREGNTPSQQRKESGRSLTSILQPMDKKSFRKKIQPSKVVYQHLQAPSSLEQSIVQLQQASGEVDIEANRSKLSFFMGQSANLHGKIDSATSARFDEIKPQDTVQLLMPGQEESHPRDIDKSVPLNQRSGPLHEDIKERPRLMQHIPPQIDLEEDYSPASSPYLPKVDAQHRTNSTLIGPTFHESSPDKLPDKPSDEAREASYQFQRGIRPPLKSEGKESDTRDLTNIKPVYIQPDGSETREFSRKQESHQSIQSPYFPDPKKPTITDMRHAFEQEILKVPPQNLNNLAALASLNLQQLQMQQEELLRKQAELGGKQSQGKYFMNFSSTSPRSTVTHKNKFPQPKVPLKQRQKSPKDEDVLDRHKKELMLLNLHGSRVIGQLRPSLQSSNNRDLEDIIQLKDLDDHSHFGNLIIKMPQVEEARIKPLNISNQNSEQRLSEFNGWQTGVNLAPIFRKIGIKEQQEETKKQKRHQSVQPSEKQYILKKQLTPITKHMRSGSNRESEEEGMEEKVVRGTQFGQQKVSPRKQKRPFQQVSSAVGGDNSIIPTQHDEQPMENVLDEAFKSANEALGIKSESQQQLATSIQGLVPSPQGLKSQIESDASLLLPQQ